MNECRDCDYYHVNTMAWCNLCKKRMGPHTQACGHGVNRIKALPLATQEGGDHYKNFPIQPVEFITENGLSFLQGSVIKRICRYNQKGGGGIRDLEKSKHEIELLKHFLLKEISNGE